MWGYDPDMLSYEERVLMEPPQSAPGGNPTNYGPRVWTQSYEYDERSWLQSAGFGWSELWWSSGGIHHSLNSSTPADNAFGVFGLGYSPNGNITGLSRNAGIKTDGSGGVHQMDRLSYHYYPGTNRLKYVSENLAGAPDDGTLGDIADQSGFADQTAYVYDEIGQLIEDRERKIRLEYDVYGKVKRIFDLDNPTSPAAPTIEFLYNALGHRIRKNDYLYVRDDAGAIMAHYRGGFTDVVGGTPPTLVEHSIYGLGRIGVSEGTVGSVSRTRSYELTDHLGNVRAVFYGTSANNLALNSYADYYPFGWRMPGRQKNPGSHRFAYQGQERDDEPGTNWEAFELRLWDGRLGRWMTTDPYNQYHSPYLGMGNNPINIVDPDGGIGERFKAWRLARTLENGRHYKDENGDWIAEGYAVSYYFDEGKGKKSVHLVYENFGHTDLHFDMSGEVSMGAQIGGGIQVGSGLQLEGMLNLIHMKLLSGKIEIDNLVTPAVEGYYYAKDGIAKIEHGANGALALAGYGGGVSHTWSFDGYFDGGYKNAMYVQTAEEGWGATPHTPTLLVHRQTLNATTGEKSDFHGFTVSIDLRFLIGIKIESNLGLTSNQP